MTCSSSDDPNLSLTLASIHPPSMSSSTTATFPKHHDYLNQLAGMYPSAKSLISKFPKPPGYETQIDRVNNPIQALLTILTEFRNNFFVAKVHPETGLTTTIGYDFGSSSSSSSSSIGNSLSIQQIMDLQAARYEQFFPLDEEYNSFLDLVKSAWSQMASLQSSTGSGYRLVDRYMQQLDTLITSIIFSESYVGAPSKMASMQIFGHVPFILNTTIVLISSQLELKKKENLNRLHQEQRPYSKLVPLSSRIPIPESSSLLLDETHMRGYAIQQRYYLLRTNTISYLIRALTEIHYWEHLNMDVDKMGSDKMNHILNQFQLVNQPALYLQEKLSSLIHSPNNNGNHACGKVVNYEWILELIQGITAMKMMVHQLRLRIEYYQQLQQRARKINHHSNQNPLPQAQDSRLIPSLPPESSVTLSLSNVPNNNNTRIDNNNTCIDSTRDPRRSRQASSSTTTTTSENDEKSKSSSTSSNESSSLPSSLSSSSSSLSVKWGEPSLVRLMNLKDKDAKQENKVEVKNDDDVKNEVKKNMVRNEVNNEAKNEVKHEANEIQSKEDIGQSSSSSLSSSSASISSSTSSSSISSSTSSSSSSSTKDHDKSGSHGVSSGASSVKRDDHDHNRVDKDSSRSRSYDRHRTRNKEGDKEREKEKRKDDDSHSHSSRKDDPSYRHKDENYRRDSRRKDDSRSYSSQQQQRYDESTTRSSRSSRSPTSERSYDRDHYHDRRSRDRERERDRERGQERDRHERRDHRDHRDRRDRHERDTRDTKVDDSRDGRDRQERGNERREQDTRDRKVDDSRDSRDRQERSNERRERESRGREREREKRKREDRDDHYRDGDQRDNGSNGRHRHDDNRRDSYDTRRTSPITSDIPMDEDKRTKKARVPQSENNREEVDRDGGDDPNKNKINNTIEDYGKDHNRGDDVAPHDHDSHGGYNGDEVDLDDLDDVEPSMEQILGHESTNHEQSDSDDPRTSSSSPSVSTSHHRHDDNENDEEDDEDRHPLRRRSHHQSEEKIEIHNDKDNKGDEEVYHKTYQYHDDNDSKDDPKDENNAEETSLHDALSDEQNVDGPDPESLDFPSIFRWNDFESKCHQRVEELGLSWDRVSVAFADMMVIKMLQSISENNGVIRTRDSIHVMIKKLIPHSIMNVVSVNYLQWSRYRRAFEKWVNELNKNEDDTKDTNESTTTMFGLPAQIMNKEGSKQRSTIELKENAQKQVVTRFVESYKIIQDLQMTSEIFDNWPIYVLGKTKKENRPMVRSRKSDIGCCLSHSPCAGVYLSVLCYDYLDRAVTDVVDRFMLGFLYYYGFHRSHFGLEEGDKNSAAKSTFFNSVKVEKFKTTSQCKNFTTCSKSESWDAVKKEEAAFLSSMIL